MELKTDFWRGKRVFITGHTGFKGGWLSLWLLKMGATLTGYALPPKTRPSLFDLARIGDQMNSRFGDVTNLDCLTRTLQEAKPDIVFHLAAQPLVRESYRQPVETFATNVMGTAHVLEASRSVASIRVMQVITTDKVYENRDWQWPYRENDSLGGHDPYSASKAACEILISSFRKSFFAAAGVSLASTRAGNVIGGGDWAEDRLLPDCIRAFSGGAPVILRNPSAVRPWQHVLEPLAGYLRLAQAQWTEAQSDLPASTWRYAQAFNFGPDSDGEATAGTVAREAAAKWGKGARVIEKSDPASPHEAAMLTLDSSLAKRMLGWRTCWTAVEAIHQSVGWYSRCDAGDDPRQLCEEQIACHESLQQ